eukprot:TRINITY_DN14248_c0_g1_i1.p2 TRINITY_DN14248_c0_g1~~TRINITY_DN14248_c0_g1_i1.p2  ORF type:complete len:211 (+),score=17.18 TRINITY_DN14248_c0_g1_i1:104-736(+)
MLKNIANPISIVNDIIVEPTNLVFFSLGVSLGYPPNGRASLGALEKAIPASNPITSPPKCPQLSIFLPENPEKKLNTTISIEVQRREQRGLFGPSKTQLTMSHPMRAEHTPKIAPEAPTLMSSLIKQLKSIPPIPDSKQINKVRAKPKKLSIKPPIIICDSILTRICMKSACKKIGIIHRQSSKCPRVILCAYLAPNNERVDKHGARNVL